MANRIREHREFKDWSQEKLAEEMGTTPQTISRLEKGQRNLNDKWLERLAKALGTTKADLLSDAFSVPGRPPGQSDLPKDATERALLDFWRHLSPEAQNVVLNIIDGWADRIIRRSDDDS